MSVYVDKPKHRLMRMKMCHLVADTIEELKDMAGQIGCHPEWFQISRSGIPHFDIPMFRRNDAVQRGAIELDRREMAALVRRLKAKYLLTNT